MLLQAGASPEFVDKVSMESAFDVAQNEEVRGILVRTFCVWTFLKSVTFDVGFFLFAYGYCQD